MNNMTNNSENLVFTINFFSFFKQVEMTFHQPNTHILSMYSCIAVLLFFTHDHLQDLPSLGSGKKNGK